MAIFSVEIADEDVSRVIDSLCANYKYSSVVLDNNANEIPNPETKPMFANRMVRKFLSEHVKRYELDLARKELEQQLAQITINDPQL